MKPVKDNVIIPPSFNCCFHSKITIHNDFPCWENSTRITVFKVYENYSRMFEIILFSGDSYNIRVHDLVELQLMFKFNDVDYVVHFNTLYNFGKYTYNLSRLFDVEMQEKTKLLNKYRMT